MGNKLDFKSQRKEILATLYKVLDNGSFVEFSEPSKCGVVTGYGTVDGRLVFILMQYSSVNAEHGEKINALYKSALNMGAPVVALLNSDGIDIQNHDNGIQAMSAYGSIFSSMTSASGVIPQLSVVLGNCNGIATLMPALSDFVFTLKKKSILFMDSPATLSGLDGKSLNAETFGGAEVHSEKTGIADFAFDDENSLFESLKQLLMMLPSNNLDEPPMSIFTDDINRTNDSVNILSGNMLDIIVSLSDAGKFIETKMKFAKEVTTGFSCLNGYTVGIVAVKGSLTPLGCEKAMSLVCFCDSFNIPVVTLQSIEDGYKYTAEEHGNAIKNCAKLMNVFSQASIPKINVIVGDSFGSPYLIFNSKSIGADMCFLWENVNTGVMKKETAIKILNLKIDTNSKVASGLFVDNVIAPSETRKYVIATLEMLASKRVLKNAKKHSNVIF